MGDIIFTPEPLNGNDRKLILYILMLIALMWALSLYAYFSLPEVIPVHFNLKGHPDSYGSKIIFLTLPILLSIAPLLLLLITRWRFEIINKYPHLINLPGFFMFADKISVHRRSYYFNRYFSVLLKFNLSLTLYLLCLLIMIYYSTVKGYFDTIGLIVFIVFPTLMVIPLFISLSKISTDMRKEIRSQSGEVKL